MLGLLSIFPFLLIAGGIPPSDQAERFELRNLFTERRLDAQIQRHVRARTPGAHPGELHVTGIAVDRHELDVAAVGLHERSHSVEDRLNPFSGDHG